MKKYINFMEKAGFSVINRVDFDDIRKMNWKDEKKFLSNIEVRNLKNNDELFEYVDYRFEGNTGRKVFVHPYKDIVGVKLNDNLLVCCREGRYPDDFYVDFYIGTILKNGSELAIAINTGLERNDCVQVKVGEVKGFSSLDFFFDNL